MRTKLPSGSAGKLILAAVAVCALSACRQDMHNQPRYKPLGETQFFPDNRQSRPLLAGVVARGELREASEFYTGKSTALGKDGKPLDLDYFPLPVTRELVERGHQRFDVFCSPCHGRIGNGLGMIVQRGMKQPPSYHIDRLRNAPPGHFFDVITNGYGAMYNYAAQIGPRDRWAIISYLRALQYSENVNASELTADARAKLPVPGAHPQQGEAGEGQTIDLPLVPSTPDRVNSPESAPLPPGTPATPMSPSPGKAGAENK